MLSFFNTIFLFDCSVSNKSLAWSGASFLTLEPTTECLRKLSVRFANRNL